MKSRTLSIISLFTVLVAAIIAAVFCIPSQSDCPEVAEAAAKVYEDPSIMTYFAIRIVDENFVGGDDYAPTMAANPAKYTEASAAGQDLVFMFSYGDDRYYLSGEQAICVNFKYTLGGLLGIARVPVSTMGFQLVSCKNGYEFLGYTYYTYEVKGEEGKGKFPYFYTLPSANKIDDLQAPVNGLSSSMCASNDVRARVLTVYVRAAMKVSLKSSDSNLGRFSKFDSFFGSSTDSKLFELPVGSKISYLPSSRQLMVEWYDTPIIGERSEAELAYYKKREYYYVVCADASVNYKIYLSEANGANWELTNGGLTYVAVSNARIDVVFWKEMRTVTFDIYSSATDPSGLDIELFGGAYNKKNITLQGGSDVVTTVVFDAPLNTKYFNVDVSARYRGEGEKYFYMSKEPLAANVSTLSQPELKWLNIFDNDFTLTENVDVSGVSIYIYELYKYDYDLLTDRAELSARYKPFYKVHDREVSLIGFSSADRPEVEGFKLLGWSEVSGSTTRVHNLSANCNTTLYAIWERTLSAVFRISDSYSVTEEHKIYNFDGALTFEVSPMPIATGSIGWSNIDAPYEKDVAVSVDHIATDGKTYMAMFEGALSLTYYTHSKHREALGIPENESRNYVRAAGLRHSNFTFTLPTLAPSLTHYDFVGYSTNSDYDNEVAEYAPGDTVTTYESDVTLYAIFKPIVYTLTIDLNGGKYKGQDELVIHIDYETRMEISKSDFVKYGYEVSSIGDATIYGYRIIFDKVGADATLIVNWQLAFYYANVVLEVGSRQFPIYPTETYASVEVEYSYYDAVNDRQVSDSVTLTDSCTNTTATNRNMLSLSVYHDTPITFTATCEYEGLCLHFGEKVAVINDSDTYTLNIEGNSRSVRLYLYEYYNVTAHSNYGEEDESINLIHWYGSVLNLDTSLFADRDGYAIKSFNTSPDGDGGAYTGYGDVDMYAVWAKYAKFYTTSVEEYEYIKFPTEGASYTISNIREDENGFKFAGWTLSPDSAAVYSGWYTVPFSDSVEWYAVYYKDVEWDEYVDKAVNFHKSGGIYEEMTVPVKITKTGKQYYAVDKTTEGERTVTSSSMQNYDLAFYEASEEGYELIGWVLGEYNTNWGYNIWRNDGSTYAVNTWTNAEFYPVWFKISKGYTSGSYTEESFAHTLYRYNKYNVYETITTKRRKTDGTFQAYGASSTPGSMRILSNVKDGREHDWEYDPLTYPSSEYYGGTNFDLLGFATDSETIEPTWTADTPQIPVTGPTTWYAVYQSKAEERRTTTLNHTLYISATESRTLTTTRTDTYINVEYRGNTTSLVSQFTFYQEGTLYTTYYSAISLPSIASDDPLFTFKGYTDAPDGCDVKYATGNFIRPTEDSALYGIWDTRITTPVHILYYWDGMGEDDSLNFDLHGSAMKPYEYFNYDLTHSQSEDWSMVVNVTNQVPDIGAEFVAWAEYADGAVRYYHGGDAYRFDDIRLNDSVRLIAVFKDPVKVTVTLEGIIGESAQEGVFTEGDEIALPALEDKEGRVFKGWQVDNQLYGTGEVITLTADMRLTAVYASPSGDNNPSTLPSSPSPSNPEESDSDPSVSLDVNVDGASPESEENVDEDNSKLVAIVVGTVVPGGVIILAGVGVLLYYLLVIKKKKKQ